MRGLMAMTAVLLAGCQTPSNVDDAGPSGEAIRNAEAISSVEAAVANTRAPEPPVPDAWLGDWKGVEGTMLTIARAPGGPGHYRLTMQYTLDARGTFDGKATGDAIAFTRPDGPQVLRRGDGKATGLKWLADKQDCVVVKPGEGYCRD